MTIKEKCKAKVETGKQFVKDHKEAFKLAGITVGVVSGAILCKLWCKKVDSKVMDADVEELVDRFFDENPDEMITHILKAERNSDYEAFVYNKAFNKLDYTIGDLGKFGEDLLAENADTPLTGVLVMGRKE